MNTKTTMYGRAINTEENPIGNWRPSWIFRVAIKTDLEHKINTKSRTRYNSELRSSRSQHCQSIRTSKIHKVYTETSTGKQRKTKIRTLFSDFAFSFLKTAFLSVRLSEAMSQRDKPKWRNWRNSLEEGFRKGETSPRETENICQSSHHFRSPLYYGYFMSNS